LQSPGRWTDLGGPGSAGSFLSGMSALENSRAQAGVRSGSCIPTSGNIQVTGGLQFGLNPKKPLKWGSVLFCFLVYIILLAFAWRCSGKVPGARRDQWQEAPLWATSAPHEMTPRCQGHGLKKCPSSSTLYHFPQRLCPGCCCIQKCYSPNLTSKISSQACFTCHLLYSPSTSIPTPLNMLPIVLGSPPSELPPCLELQCRHLLPVLIVLQIP
jgi:hypothetical protein